MNLFRKRNATTPDEPGERHCRGCGSALAEDQLACLECGAVDVVPAGRDRRWLLPTGGLVGVALLLVTSASFAATTALNTGDPQAIKPKPPAPVAQAPPPPASGTGTVPNSAEEENKRGPDLGDLPSGGGGAGGGGGAPAPPAGGGGSGDAPADDGADAGSGGGSGGGGSNGGGGSSGGSGGSNSGGGTDTKPDEPAPVQVAEWPDGAEGYTVKVYKFDAKSDAKLKAREIAAKGLPAGVLDSDKYPSLTPGSWLVYIGQFDNQKQAERAAAKYENAGYPGEVVFVGQNETPESDPSADGSSTTPQQP